MGTGYGRVLNESTGGAMPVAAAASRTLALSPCVGRRGLAGTAVGRIQPVRKAFRRQGVDMAQSSGSGGGLPWACLGIFAINVGVFTMWRVAEDPPTVMYALDVPGEPPLQVAPTLAFMNRHFTVSWANVLGKRGDDDGGRWYTVLTSAFSHADLKHLLMNSVTLVFFGSLMEHTLGRHPFIAFYVTAAVASGAAHLWYPWVSVALREKRWYTDAENAAWRAWRGLRGVASSSSSSSPRTRPQTLTDAWRARVGGVASGAGRGPYSSVPDRAAVGASGSLYACIAVGTLLNPWAPLVYVPLPLWTATTYFFYDDFRELAANDGVGHASHLGGAVFGIIYFLAFLRRHRVPAAVGFNHWRSTVLPRYGR